jgi:Ca2+-binding RTX toxin-like protein
MRRAILLLMLVAAVLALTGGAVLAVDKTCFGSDCVGTRGADKITSSSNGPNNIAGMEGNDIITSGVFHDDIYGDEGNDTITDNNASSSDVDRIYGDEGNDTIDVQEGDEFPDMVNCVPGTKDKVFFDEGFDTVTSCDKKNSQEV